MADDNSDELPAEERRADAVKTEWHLLFAVEQDLALTPVGIGVEAEFSVMKEPPKAELGFVPTKLPGVLHGENIYVRHVTILLLNELRDVPHNALVKTFASRQTEKRKAFKALDDFHDLPGNLVTYLQGLRTIWSLPKGAEMNERLTPEWVMEVGEAWKKL